MKLGIRTKLLVWLVLVALPIAAASTFAVRVIDTRLSERIETDLENSRRLEAARITDALEAYGRDVVALAAGRHVQDFVDQVVAHRAGMLDAGTVIGAIDGFDRVNPDAERPLQQLAEALQRKAAMVGTEVVDLQLLSRDGQVLGQTNDFAFRPYDPTLVDRAIHSRDVTFGNAFRKEAGVDRLGMVAPIFNSRSVTVGALVVETRLGPVLDLISKHEGFATSSEAHVAQRTSHGDAEFITHLRFERDAAFQKRIATGSDAPITQALTAGEGTILRARDYRNVDSVLALETIPQTGWGLVVKIDAAEAFAPVAEARSVVILATLVTIAVVVLGWMLFLHPIASRLQLAARAADRVASGDYRKPIGDPTHDEIGEISRSIDRLAQDLDADIRMRAEAERRLIYQAEHDELTGLYNRKYANARIDSLGRSDDHDGASIMFLDLDGFKRVNDRYGHAAGDEVLVTVARRLSAAIDPGDTLARWGGDEFVIVMPEADQARATDMAERIRYLFAEPIMTSFGRHLLGCSIGLASASGEEPLDHVLLEADARMYREKQSRASRRPGSSNASNTVETALEENRVEIWYQPIVKADRPGTAEVVGAEALVRIRARHGEMIAPGCFLAEISNRRLGRELDRRVLSRSLAALSRWRRSGMVGPRFLLSVNLTGQSLRDPTLLGDIRAHCERLELDPSWLALEISESTDDIDDELIFELRRLGVRIALDDVGLQYSNLDRLMSVRPDIVKIDRRWLSDSPLPEADMEEPTTNNTRIVLPKLVEIARSTGASVTAEGVETETQLDLLRSLGVRRIQGYLFDQPQPAATFISRWGALGFDADLDAGLALPIAS